MTTNSKGIASMALALVLMFMSLGVSAQTTPRWVKKGVTELNDERSNNSYTFVKLNTTSLDIDGLKANRTEPLKAWIIQNDNAKPGTVEITQMSPLPSLEYKISFESKEGKHYTVDAKLVDEYTEFDDYELNVYQYEFYQLYAISRPNVKPEFDNFSLTQTYDGITTGLSFVPGLAQIYKGQTTKGYVIMGSEAALAIATLVFEYQRHDAHKMWKKGDYSASWKSKEIAWRNFELGSAAAFVGLYIYNVIDGMTAKGVRQVKVSRTHSPFFYSLKPFATTDEMGLSFSINF